MVLEVSSPRIGSLSDSDCVSDPEEKEISDDDDDRNHKHRRPEARSHSMERESSEQVLERPYRKRNRPFDNGASDSWTGKFDKRRFSQGTFPRSDFNQRVRANHLFSGDAGSGRGRGRGRGRVSGSWNHPAFGSIDAVPQMVQHHAIPPTFFTGRGMSDLSNSHNASWGSYGLIPGMPNGGLDALHPIGMQGSLRPGVNAPLNAGIPRQRCRDFEERGFCLRGDMCPMEHGVNRIVVDDVQSLSQFNLPATLPNAHPHGGPGAAPSVGAPSAATMNNKGLESRSGKPGFADDDWELNGAYTGLVGAEGADLYDPDQPLWNNNGPDCYLNNNPSDHCRTSKGDSVSNYNLAEKNRSALGSQTANSTVWGRVGSSTLNEIKGDQDAITSALEVPSQGKRTTGSTVANSLSKFQGGMNNSFRKPSQKAQRTLFVSGIPQKDNKMDLLLSHFKKFGEVMDIYIPSSGERAFVQFFKKEDAETALKAPDAVMGNRFIKLWWANRDRITDNGYSSSVGVTSQNVANASVSLHLPNAHRNNDKLEYAIQKPAISSAFDDSVPSSDRPKPLITNGPKDPPHLQKKQEALRQLKKELRKKQELLDQKRNDFRRKLNKLQKQASGDKGEAIREQADEVHKVEVEAENTTLRSTDLGNHCAPPATSSAEKNCSMETAYSNGPKTNVNSLLPDPITLKQQFRPLVPVGAPFPVNRYKLDNRPTAFKVLPPLPPGLANVDILKEHFSSFGDEPGVEWEDSKNCDDSNGVEKSKDCPARINFTTRRSAERAYISGKCWQGHNLQLMWLTPSTSKSACKGFSLSTSKSPLDADVKTAGELVCKDSQRADALGDGGAEASERIGSVEHLERGEDSHVEASPNSSTGNETP